MSSIPLATLARSTLRRQIEEVSTARQLEEELQRCKDRAAYFLFRYCTPAETPIWMGDYTFKPISEVSVGDVVVGWQDGEAPEPGRRRKRRRLARATVTNTIQLPPQPVLKVTMASGRVLRCTADHLWLMRKWRGGSNNTDFGTVEVGRKVCRVVDVPGEVPAGLRQTAAWLGGVYDGEGTGSRIAQCAEHNPEVYAAICGALTALGFSWLPFENRKKGTPAGVRFNGGRDEAVRFINWCNPVRKDHNNSQGNNWVLGGSDMEPDEIVGVEADGVEPVFALTTTTGNYVAWGYASKSCQTQDEHDMGVFAKPFPELEYIREVVDILQDQRRVAVEKSRQMMISWIVCAFVLWVAMFHPNVLFFVQSKKEEDAADRLDRIYKIYFRLPKFIRERFPINLNSGRPGTQLFTDLYFTWQPGDKAFFNLDDSMVAEGSGFDELVRSNAVRSRIWAIPQGAHVVRQYTATGIFSDEDAFQELAGEAYAAYMPTLDHNSWVIKVSTANPGHFESICKDREVR